MTDVFRELPRFSWRGIELPLLDRSAKFSHSKAIHTIEHSGEIVQVLGTQNMRFTYTIPFRQDINKGPYKNLFTETFPKFFEAMRDDEPGELMDPVLGPWRCSPDSFEDTSVATQRAGDTVTDSYTHDPDGLELDDLALNVSTIQGSLKQAETIDVEIVRITTEANESELTTAEASLRAEFAQQEPPKSLANPLDVASGLLRQGQRFAEKIDAAIADTVFRAEKLESSVKAVSEPELWSISRRIRTLRRALQRIAYQRSQARPLRVVSLDRDMPIGQVANRFGLTLSELLKLNPALGSLPVVVAGTIVRFYR